MPFHRRISNQMMFEKERRQKHQFLRGVQTIPLAHSCFCCHSPSTLAAKLAPLCGQIHLKITVSNAGKFRLKRILLHSTNKQQVSSPKTAPEKDCHSLFFPTNFEKQFFSSKKDEKPHNYHCLHIICRI